MTNKTINEYICEIIVYVWMVEGISKIDEDTLSINTGKVRMLSYVVSTYHGKVIDYKFNFNSCKPNTSITVPLK